MLGTIELIIFFILAGIGIFSALVVVSGRNMFHNILFFGLFLLTISGHFLLLKADFLAMAQIFGYVGGIVVLILFVVMLTRNITEAEAETDPTKGIIAFFITLALLVTIFYIFKITTFSVLPGIVQEKSVVAIGKMLLSSRVIPFEIAAVVLLAAIVGGLSVAREGGK